MQSIVEDNQKIACLALHLAGHSNRSFFKYYANISKLDYVQFGYSFYGDKFNILINDANEKISIHNQKNIKLLTILDNEYPSLLKESINPPLALFYTGELDLLSKPLISIVGTREPSLITNHWLKPICEFISKQGYVLVSGLAMGIDSLVHASSYTRGTIGISPQSLDLHNPRANKYLFESAMYSKNPVLILSEYPVTTNVRKYHYIQRNRIVAGISENTIFVEGGIKSGAMITANWCLKNNRGLFVIYSIAQKNNHGGLKLIEEDKAKNISSFFPMKVHLKKYEDSGEKFLSHKPVYLGNARWISVNKSNFSLKFLWPD